MASTAKPRKPKVVYIETSETSSESTSDNENVPPQEVKKRGRPAKIKTKTRKPRTLNITEQAKAREDLTGIWCSSCGLRTRDVNREIGMNKVGRLNARATCECGAKKTKYLKKPEELPAIAE